MDAQQVSAILLIASFAVVLLSMLLIAPGLYQTQDIEERLRIIEKHKMRWLISEAAIFVYAALSISGFAILAYMLRTAGQSWLPVLATVAIAGGALVGSYFVYLQITDPRGGYSGAYPAAENLAYWLWLAGTLLFGIAFLQGDLPNWLGILTAGATVAYGIAFAITGAGFMTPFIVAFLSLVIGIVLLST